MDALSELQNWYFERWDDDQFRPEDEAYECKIRVGTLDHPTGWSVTVSVPTSLWQVHEFAPVEYGNSRADWLMQKEEFGNWIRCRMKPGKWQGKCGAQKLDEMVGLFLQWAHEASDKREKSEREEAERRRQKMLEDSA